MNTPEREERNIEAPGVQELSNKLLHIYANGDMDDVSIFILKCKRDYDRAAIGPKDELIDHKEKEIKAIKSQLSKQSELLEKAKEFIGHKAECEHAPNGPDGGICDCGYLDIIDEISKEIQKNNGRGDQ